MVEFQISATVYGMYFWHSSTCYAIRIDLPDISPMNNPKRQAGGCPLIGRYGCLKPVL